jgi:hypothetical protein
VDGVQCRSLVLGKGKDAPLFFINWAPRHEGVLEV